MDLENFFGSEQDESMSAASFEKFKEKMKAAAAQIAQIQKEEKRQKQKEDELVKILLKFIKTSQKQELVLLISRALEQNIPANFILAIILLSNPEIESEIKGNFLMLKGKIEELSEEKQENSLVFFKEETSLPLKNRIEMDNWLKNMLIQAEEKPLKLLRFAYDIEEVPIETEDKYIDEDERPTKEVKVLKVTLIQLTVFVLREYLEQNSISQEAMDLHDFVEFILKGILNKVEENLNNRKLLE